MRRGELLSIVASGRDGVANRSRGDVMRLLGSLVFLIGAVCVGANVYFPHSGAHLLPMAGITHLLTTGDSVADASNESLAPTTNARNFSPGPQAFRSGAGSSTKTASAHRRDTGSPNLAYGESGLTVAANSDEIDANAGNSWKTVTSSIGNDVRRTAPKRSDYVVRVELIRSLQSELARVGCYRGDVDGDWGPGSKRAAGEFLRKVNATLPVDTPDYILLTLIQGHADKACGVDCPSGHTLASNGRCVSSVIVAQVSERGKLVARKALGGTDGKPSAKEAFVVAAAPVRTNPPARPASRIQQPGVKTVVASADELSRTLPKPTGMTDLRGSNDVARGSEVPVARPDPLPGMMSVGAPLEERSAIPVTPVVAAIAPDPVVAPQSSSRGQVAPAKELMTGTAQGVDDLSARNRTPNAAAVVRPQRDVSTQKNRKDKEQRRARNNSRDMVRTYSGRVRRGSPQYNLMLSLGGVF
mgnify:CR=1 FL=1